MAVMVSLLVAVPALRRVVDEIGRMGPGWLCVAVVLEVASCCSFVVVFRLFFDRLPGATARPLAWIEMGAGALLPGGGIGSLAVGGWLLHQAGMSRRRILPRALQRPVLPHERCERGRDGRRRLLLTGSVSGPHDLLRAGVPILAGIAVTAAVLAVPAARRRSHQRAKQRWLGDLIDGIDTAAHALIRPTWRLLRRQRPVKASAAPPMPPSTSRPPACAESYAAARGSPARARPSTDARAERRVRFACSSAPGSPTTCARCRLRSGCSLRSTAAALSAPRAPPARSAPTRR